VKGLYARYGQCELRHLTGVDDPYESPLAPELVLRTCCWQRSPAHADP
jgi:adenylylsulfate kinase